MKRLVSRRPLILLTLLLLVSGPKAARTGLLEDVLLGEPAPAPATDTLRVLTWNVAHGRADGFHQALLPREEVERNLDRIARVLRHERPDVVALQEADGPSAWSGGFDHVSVLARDGGLGHFYRGDHNPFGVGAYELSSGTALVSRLPMAGPESRAFAANWRDTKGFVAATVRLPESGREVDVVSVHLDFLNPAERRRQIQDLSAALGERSRPLIVLGDLNCEADAGEVFRLFEEHLGVRPYRPEVEEPTFPSTLPIRRLDWILASEELEFVGYRTLEVRLSDHLGVVAEIRLAG